MRLLLLTLLPLLLAADFHGCGHGAPPQTPDMATAAAHGGCREFQAYIAEWAAQCSGDPCCLGTLERSFVDTTGRARSILDGWIACAIEAGCAAVVCGDYTVDARCVGALPCGVLIVECEGDTKP